MNQQHLDIGTVVDGKYRLDRPIGHGGFSTVYRGTHTEMDRPVAVKIFAPDEQDTNFEQSRQRLQRFEQEARLVSRLEHPNTITIFDFGVEDDGSAFLVMEFIEGPTLKQVFDDQGRLDVDRTLRIFLQILASLEEAHHRDILHRDIKPANIMLATDFKGEEVVKVLDFGIAQMLRSDDDDEDNNLFVGTPRYAAPEMLTGADLRLSTDIYGIGALMWESLTGEPMLPSSDIHDCVAHATSARPWEMPDDPDVPAELQRIIERAVRKSPSERYEDASAMLEALEYCSTIERSEIPSADDDSPFLPAGPILDPNVGAPDDDGPWLGDAESEPDEPTPPLPDDSDDALLPPTMEPSSPPELALDELDDPPPRLEPDDNDEPTESAEAAPAPTPTSRRSLDTSPAPPTRADSLEDRLRRFGPVRAVVDGRLEPQHAVAAIAVAVFAIFATTTVLLTVGDDADDRQVTDEAAAEETDDEAAYPLRDQSPHTTDGITSAIRADGWRIERSRDPVEMSRYSYQSLVVSSNGNRLDVRIYVTNLESALDDILSDISGANRAVTFDHIIVEIRPREDGSPHHADRLGNFLRDFRNGVAQKARE